MGVERFLDGELLASDAARFGALKGAVDADLADRRDWFARAEKNRTERFKRQNTATSVYDGAPNLVDPLIGAESEPPVRPWPFVQFRNEDAVGFYNARGIPELS